MSFIASPPSVTQFQIVLKNLDMNTGCSRWGKTVDIHAVMLFSMIARTVGASIPLICLEKPGSVGSAAAWTSLLRAEEAAHEVYVVGKQIP